MTENDIIEAARERLGNTVDRSVDEQSVPSQAISAELRSYLVEISKAFGSGSSRKDFNFFSVPGQQDYPIVATIGSDVRDIQEVLRSDAYVSESFLEPTMVDPRTGVPVARASFIDQAYQQDALDVIVAQQRFRRQDMYDWEVVNTNGILYLRLMPPPTDVSTISVRYVATSESVDSLPEEAREAAENAACVCLFDCLLNRVNSNPPGSGETARDRRYWLELVERQRGRYEAKYRVALSRTPNR